MARLTLYNVGICIIVAVGGYTFGFAYGVFVTSIGQPGFYLYFNLDPTSNYTASILGAVNALFAFGAAIGAIAQCYLADWLGRKKALATAAVCTLIGSALVAGSVAVAMLIVVRILQGFGVGMLLCLVPLYLTEVAPPHRRGLLTGLTTLGFGLGFVVNAWVGVGAFKATDLTLGWRLPLALACIGPLVLLAGLPFVPESPRYLVWVGKLEEAWTVMRQLHHDSSDSSEDGARAEYTQIVRQVEFDKEIDAGFIQMFKKPSWRRRCLSVMFLLFAVQSTGVLGILNYAVLIFQSLGLEGQMPLVVYAIHTTSGTIWVVVAIFIADKVGRRRLFLIGFPALACCLLAEALLQWKYLGTESKAGNAGAVLFIFLYIMFFQCVDAPAIIWAAEIFPTTIRAKGLSLAFFANWAGAITFTSSSALAFNNIGWRMYIIYMVLCIISAVIVYLYLPETKGLPVEEIGALFGDEVIVHLTADGHGIVEDKATVEEIEGDKAGSSKKV